MHRARRGGRAMRAPRMRPNRNEVRRRTQRWLTLLIVLSLIASGLPQQVVRFAQTGNWPENPAIALASPIPPTIGGSGSSAWGGIGLNGALFFDSNSGGVAGNVMLVMFTFHSPSSAQDIVSVTDATTGAAWTRIGFPKSADLGVGAFWHKKLTGEGTHIHLNFALPADQNAVPATNVWGRVDNWIVSGALAATPFEFRSSSNNETPGGTTVHLPDFSPLTDGELIISLTGFYTDSISTTLGTPSGTNPTFSVMEGEDGLGTVGGSPGVNVSSAPATDTTPLGIRSFTASAPIWESVVLVFAAISAG